MRIHLLLPLAALLIVGVIGTRGWAQDAPTTPTDLQFQPANPDAPPPGDASPEAQTTDAANAKPPGEDPAEAGDAPEKPAEPDLQQAQSPDAPAPDAPAPEAQSPDAPAPDAAPDTAGEAPAQQAPKAAVEAKPEPASAEVPAESKTWTETELAKIYQPNPTSVRVAVLGTSGRARSAGLITFLLEEYRKKHLERKIGKLIAVVNQSNVTGRRLKNSVISYRPGNLRAALIMADVIPGKQYVAPMVPENTVKIAVDVEIRVGMELP